MSIPHLPAEITDEIIAWIPESILHQIKPKYYPTLLSCCLVCSCWLPASRHQLFREVFIGSLSNYDLFVARVLRQETMRAYLAVVRTLSFARSWGAVYPDRARTFLQNFAGQLPSLKGLSVPQASLNIYFSNHPRAFLALSGFPSIRTLVLESTLFPSFGALRHTLMLLPNLTDLRMIGELFWYGRSIEMSPLLPQCRSGAWPLTLTALSIYWICDRPQEYCRARHFLEWLNTTLTSSSLRVLDLTIVSRRLDLLVPSISQLCRFVEKFTFSTVAAKVCDFLPLISQLPSLTTLEISWQRGEPISIGPIVSILSSLPAPNVLQGLTISGFLRMPTQVESGAFDWVSALSVNLARETFSGLKEVTIRVYVILRDQRTLHPFTSVEHISEHIRFKALGLIARRLVVHTRARVHDGSRARTEVGLLS